MQERNTLGATLKDRGNKLYSKKDFRRAVEWSVSPPARAFSR